MVTGSRSSTSTPTHSPKPEPKQTKTNYSQASPTPNFSTDSGAPRSRHHKIGLITPQSGDAGRNDALAILSPYRHSHHRTAGAHRRTNSRSQHRERNRSASAPNRHHRHRSRRRNIKRPPRMEPRNVVTTIWKSRSLSASDTPSTTTLPAKSLSGLINQVLERKGATAKHRS